MSETWQGRGRGELRQDSLDAYKRGRDDMERAIVSVGNDDMCPNCVTPWKCNGPHCPPLPDDEAASSSAHWLTFNADRHVSGCICGFPADPADEGFGDSVVRHLINVGRSEARA